MIRTRTLDARTNVVGVEGELDLRVAPEFKRTLLDLLDSGHSRIVVDLSRVTFMDSTGVGVLVGIKRGLGSGEQLAIACPQPSVLRIFEVTGLDRAFDIFATLEGALTHATQSVAAAG